MSDQAEALRTLATHIVARRSATGKAVAQIRASFSRVIAVTSGKGGVGKTNITVNLAIALARMGQRVLIFDADLGLANVDTVAGVEPVYTLQHALSNVCTLEEAVCDGPGGIKLISGGSGVLELVNLNEQRRRRIVRDLAKLEHLADWIFLDTGAGISRNVLSFVQAAAEVQVVTTPEPTAVCDAYATIKVACQRNSEVSFKLLVNMAASEREGMDVARNMAAVASEFLNTTVETLGIIPQDPALPRAVRLRRPVLLEAPKSPVSTRLTEIASFLLTGQQPIRRIGFADFVERLAGFLGVGTRRGEALVGAQHEL